MIPVTRPPAASVAGSQAMDEELESVEDSPPAEAQDKPWSPYEELPEPFPSLWDERMTFPDDIVTRRFDQFAYECMEPAPSLPALGDRPSLAVLTDMAGAEATTDGGSSAAGCAAILEAAVLE